MSVLETPRARLAVVGVAAAGVLGVLGVSGLQQNLVYYRTPSELGAGVSSSGERVRVGGLVERGSVTREGEVLHFVLTDGARDIRVAYQGKTPGVFRAGQGAIVEGSMGAGGQFDADTVLVKHSNEYVDGRSNKPYVPPSGR